jgi:hypothetical protein
MGERNEILRKAPAQRNVAGGLATKGETRFGEPEVTLAPGRRRGVESEAR